jgi:Macrocin-O-methyltransferase (TylF)
VNNRKKIDAAGRKEKDLVAWGTGTLLHNYLTVHPKDHGLSYVVDSFQKEAGKFMGLPLLPADELKTSDPANVVPVIFCVSNQSQRSIALALNALGFQYGCGYIDSADLFRSGFEEKLRALIGKPPGSANYCLARSHYNNSHVPVQTTVCGNWLLLECLEATAGFSGHIAEIGSYRGGNSVLMLQSMAARKDFRHYFIMDSFEGFPELSAHDPRSAQHKFDEEYNLLEIEDRFSMFEDAEIIRGFVPEALNRLPVSANYSVVFFDCDLYEPAAAALEYFWGRILPQGYIVLHDYMHQVYGGVQRAVDEFCERTGVKATVFFESTMAVLKKV